MAGTRSNATEVRDSIEAKGDKAQDVEMKDARDEEEDADGEPDAEGEEDDADGDGDEDEDADMDDDDPANFRQLIDKLQTFLSSYEENGEELASGFQRIPNKRVLPDYFAVIDTPVAFSTVRHKLQKKLYTGFTEFVRDVAQICHNAQVYNRPSAPIFGAAVRLRVVFKEELDKLVAKGTIKPEEAVLPDLGELPPADESPEPEADEEEDEEEEDEEEEEEDDADDSDDEARIRRLRKGRHAAKHDDDPYRKRGRPPKLLTPTEARIDAVLRELRKVKDDDGDLIITDFEKLPDKTEYPEYYETIQQPIAIEGIKRKVKRKQYNSVDHALLDLDLMFNNAQQFNEDGSEIFENAVRLQAEARRLVAEQKARPDDDFRDDDGKLPLSEIWHRAEKYQVGDWVHIKNGNPDNKPIVAQIFRTWQDRDGKRMINACWYYHPEQTVHRFDKHFYEHEVAKSGQYRDHPIESVIEKCFVMFHTRFFKGRPRGFSNKSVYVCESRYNEDQCCFRKIKTWASCVPDEVRSRDYEMDMFPVPLSNVKIPSPIKHLVRSDATETSELPKPTWGDKHSPPIVGAVHRRPRDPRDSPPPTKKAQPATNQPYFDPSRRQSFHQGGRPNEMMMSQSPARSYVGMPGQMPHGGPSPSPGPYQQQPQGYASASPVAHHSMPSHPQQPMNMQQMQPSPRPYYNQQRLQPMQQAGYQQTFQTQPPPFQAPPQQHQQPPQHMIQPYQQQQQLPPQQHHQAPQQHHQQMYAQTPVGMAPQQQMHSHGANPAQPNFDPRMNINAGRNTMASTPAGNPAPQANVFRGPEVYTLADQANDAIPAQIRERFHRDEHNKVIFFTVPPDAPPSSGLSHESEGLGHSARYLANRDKYLARKQQRRDELSAKKNIAELRRAANMPEGQEREDEINRIVDDIVAGLTAWTASHTKETERLFKQLGVSPARIASAQSN